MNHMSVWKVKEGNYFIKTQSIIFLLNLKWDIDLNCSICNTLAKTLFLLDS